MISNEYISFKDFENLDNPDLISSLTEGPKFTPSEAAMIQDKCSKCVQGVVSQNDFLKLTRLALTQVYAGEIIANKHYNSTQAYESKKAYELFYEKHVTEPAKVYRACDEVFNRLHKDYLTQEEYKEAKSSGWLVNIKNLGLAKTQATFLLKEEVSLTPRFAKSCEKAYEEVELTLQNLAKNQENFLSLPGSSPRTSLTQDSPKRISDLFRTS
ncbi:MAG: hypothetical protein V4489_07150 [Chlamydiota bacterium]